MIKYVIQARFSEPVNWEEIIRAIKLHATITARANPVPIYLLYLIVLPRYTSFSLEIWIRFGLKFDLLFSYSLEEIMEH